MSRGRTLAALLATLAVAVVVGGFPMRACAPRPTLYVGGPILTMDAQGRVVEALGVEGQRILAVGEESALRPWAEQAGARVVDLGGRALLPGFIDAHGHFPGAGLEALAAVLSPPPIADIRDLDDVVEALRARADVQGGDDWVIGWGYDDTLLAERRHPTRHDLDRVSNTRPVGALHISGHLAVVNTPGLARLGFTRDTRDPVGGVIQRDANGDPNGVLEETPVEALQHELQNPGLLDGWRMLRRANELYLAQGVTTAQAGAAGPTELRLFPLLARLGLLPLRLVIWPEDATRQKLDAGELEFSSADRLRVGLGATKLIADGSIQGYTGYLAHPYHVPPGDDPGYRGYPRIPREDLFRKVAREYAAGRQVAIHGNGDASIEDILDAVEAAQRAHPREDPRTVVIHAQMTRPDQLDRMLGLRIIPSFFSLHTFYWGDRHRDIFMGPERASRMSPAASAQARGIRFTIHCDAPVVPMEPLRLVWSAVNRISTGGIPIGPAERIDVMSALRAVTIDAAHQHFEEEHKGSLSPGKLADMVILDRSPLDDPAGIDEIRVLETIVGGETVWQAPDAGVARR